MDNSGEALYSPTQNFNDEDFKSEPENDDKKSKNSNKGKVKVNGNENNPKENKKSKNISKRSKSKKTKKSDNSPSSKSKSRSRSKSSRSASSPSNSSSSKSSSKSRKKKSRSRHKRESRHRRRRDDSKRVLSKQRRSRSREDKKHKHSDDTYGYHSRRRSRDHIRGSDISYDRSRDRGDRGRDRGRGRDQNNSWRRDRSEHYRTHEKKEQPWDKNFDKYNRDGRDSIRKQSRPCHQDDNILENKLNDIHDDGPNKYGQKNESVKEDSCENKKKDEALIIPKQHVPRLESFDIRPNQPSNYEFRQRHPSDFEGRLPIRPLNSFDSILRPDFEPRPPLAFGSRPPPLFQPNFRDIRPGNDAPSGLIQLGPGMPYNHNQQFRIIGPPRQQGGLVFRPVQMMEPPMDWRMPIISQPSSLYRSPQMEYPRHQGNMSLLPLPQLPPLHSQTQQDGQNIIARSGGSSPPPPPPPAQFIRNQLNVNNRFIQPGEFNRFSLPPSEIENHFNQPPMIAPLPLQISTFNPNIPPPNIHQQFIKIPLPQPQQPSSPQTPLQSEELVADSSPRFKSPLAAVEANCDVPQRNSPYSMNSEPDYQYDAYQDDLFADSFNRKSQTPSPKSPESTSSLTKKIINIEKSESPRVDQIKLPSSSQEHKLAKIAPFSIGSQKRQTTNNPAINQVFGTVTLPPTKPLSPLPVQIPGLSVVDSLEQLTSLLNSASSGVKSMDLKQPDFSSLASFVANQSPLEEELDIPMDLAASASQQTIQLARQLGLFELTKVLEQATAGNEAAVAKEMSEKVELPKKGNMEVVDSSFEKLSRVERIAEEVKLALKPHFARNIINKEDYKDIMRKAVPKISGSKSELDRSRIKTFIFEYVQKIHQAKKLAKSEQKKFHKKTS